MSNFRIFIPLAISFLIIYLFMMFKTGNGQYEEGQEIEQQHFTLCTLGESMECTYNNCTGHRVCRASGWSECIIDMDCKPGEKRKCFISPCKVGVQVCDRCGKWSPCQKEH